MRPSLPSDDLPDGAFRHPELRRDPRYRHASSMMSADLHNGRFDKTRRTVRGSTRVARLQAAMRAMRGTTRAVFGHRQSPFRCSVADVVADGANPEMGGIAAQSVIAAVANTGRGNRQRNGRRQNDAVCYLVSKLMGSSVPAKVFELTIAVSEPRCGPKPTIGRGSLCDFAPEAIGVIWLASHANTVSDCAGKRKRIICVRVA